VIPAAALTIAGSDSGGAAGIQADLKTFAALGVYGTSVITAVTAQNTLGVKAVAYLEPAIVAEQISAVLADTPIRAVKTGMLATTAIVEVVASSVSEGGLPLIVDPVIVATSGARLLDMDALDAYRSHLFPKATVITPNAEELAVLLGRPSGSITTLEELRGAARELADRTGCTIVAKGGHLSPVDATLTDLIVTHDEVVELHQSYVATRNTHGTGCTFSAAIAAYCARGVALHAAIEAAQHYVHGAIASAADWHVGAGHGPLNHFSWPSTGEGMHP
jgi:hydroxymethylpyrimidine/phosphomethylpyrimidine kinase